MPQPEDLTAEAAQAPADPAKRSIEALVGQKWADVEKALILATLRHNSGHREKSAKMLDIGVRTLGLKINQYREAGEAIPSRGTTEISPPDSPVEALVGKKSAEVEDMLILATLNHYKGHRKKTAETLDIGLRTLGLKLKQFRQAGLTIPSPARWVPVEVPGQAEAVGEAMEAKPVVGAWTAGVVGEEQTQSSGRTAA